MALKDIRRGMRVDTMLSNIPNEYVVRFTRKSHMETRTMWQTTDTRQVEVHDHITVDIIDVETGAVLVTKQHQYADEALGEAVAELKLLLKKKSKEKGIQL